MNCLTARETLDLIRPQNSGVTDEGSVIDTDGNELSVASIDEAARHVKTCPTCQMAVRRREQFDERIGQLMRDVPIPAGQRDRLLARLSHESRAVAETGSPPSAVVPVPGSDVAGKPAIRSRRRLMVSAVAACFVTAACIGVSWQMLKRAPLLRVDEITGIALEVKAADLPAFAQFKGGLGVQFPKTMKTPSVMQSLRRLVGPPLGEREIAVYFFMHSNDRGGKFPGRLVVVPAALVKDLPGASSFPGQTLYRQGFCTAAWVEGNFVYLCCVEGGERELLLLRLTREAA